MATRLGNKPAPVAVPAPTQHEFISVRAKGLKLIDTLAPTSLQRVTSIDSPEGYLEMDAKLGTLRNARAQWKLMLEPIAGPLQTAIQKQKEALAAAKKAADGVAHLDQEVGSQIDRLEAHMKGLLRDYKVEEARQIQAAEQAKKDEQRQLQEAARQKALQAASARTPQLRARLEQQRAELEAQAEQVVEEIPVPAPIKGAASVSRTQKKVRVSDPIAFLRAVVDYDATMGVYRTGVPPLMVTDKKGEVAALVDIVSARLTDLYREQPGVVLSWPGIEEWDDISIAGK